MVEAQLEYEGLEVGTSRSSHGGTASSVVIGYLSVAVGLGLGSESGVDEAVASAAGEGDGLTATATAASGRTLIARRGKGCLAAAMEVEDDMAPASALTPPPRLKPTDEIVNTTTKAQPARDRKLTDHPLKTAAPSHENVHAGTILLSRRRPAFARSDGKQAVWPSRYSHAMKIGVAVGGTLQEVSSLARKAEAAGLESVWLAELDRTALVQAAAAILATSRIGVGTAVALAFPRSPTVTAMTAWDLDEMSGDRFMLGLGPQVKRVLEARFSVRVDKPAPQMREYVQAVRTVWAANRGEAVIHEGDAYRITMPTFHGPARPERRDTPILLAAVGPAMSRVCGDVADGLLGHPLASPRYLRERVQPSIDAGLERSGRPIGASPAGASPAGASPAGASPAGACPITAMALVSLGDDADAARRAARLQIAFYATTPSYKAILALHDRESLPRDLRRAFVNRDLDRMAELIDDELLDAIAISGRPDEAADRLKAWEGVADRVVLGVPWYGMDADRQREAIAAALEFGASVAAPAAPAAPAFEA